MRTINDRLAEINKTTLRKSLTAMRKLKRYYENDYSIEYMAYCPLCRAVRDSCSRCPWCVMTRANCGRWSAYKFPGVGVEALRRKERPKWAALRIEQLTKWIDRYKQELEGRS